MRESQPEDAIEAPGSGSEAAVATTVDGNTTDSSFDDDITDNFDGIDWLRLPQYCKPLAS